MKYRVLRDNHFLGELSFTGTMHHFTGDDATRVLIADQVRSGVSYLHDEHAGGSDAIVQSRVEPTSPLFAFALIETLRARGLHIEAIDPATEHNFENIVARVSRTAPPEQVAQLRARWSHMSLLEKTYLLELLEREGVMDAP